MVDILEKAHFLSIQEICKVLDTSLQGISQKEAAKRLEEYGTNVLEEEKISILKIFWKQFHSILVYILIAASCMSILIGNWNDFFVISGIVLVNACIGFWQEIRAVISIKGLKKLTETTEIILRDKKEISIPSSNLVVGDLVILSEGDIIGADIRLVDSVGLVVDESLITGESVPTLKDHVAKVAKDAFPYEWENMLLSGTTVVRGQAKGIVVRTGKNTYFAKIAEKVKEPPPQTPLTRAISFFARRYIIFLILLFVAIAFFSYVQHRPLFHVGYVLLVELVSAVPEGLPIVVTLVMVVGAIALSKKNTLVRYLPSVETLGSTTVIACDKTGTITWGKLAVQEIYALDEEKLKLVASLCNEAKGPLKDPIDAALAKWVGRDFEEIRRRYIKIGEYPFDVRTRMMASKNRNLGSEKLFIKGAWEALKTIATNSKDFKEIEASLEKMSNEGLRTLAFAVGEGDEDDPSSWQGEVVGIVGFLDPPKIHVKEAVSQAKRAGIRVIMITGDYATTAKAIAKEVGIWREKDLVLIGKEIEEMDDLTLFACLKKSTVLARILPEHKHRIVKVLQKNGEIVAVSGDGVNDVPALQAADLGIAMGSGTQAAIIVSKMVITDNNLKVIVDAIKNGRVIADNIRKVIYYLLSSALQEISLISLAIFAGLPLPLFAIQILWINLITDGVQDKAFPFAKEEGSVMDRKPSKPGMQFFNLFQIYRILFFGMTTGLASFFLFKHLLQSYSYTVAVTITFTCVAVIQWFNGIQAQKENEPFFRNIKTSLTINPYIFIGIGIGLALQLFAVYGAPSWFGCVSISLFEWKYPLLFSVFAFAVIELRKWLDFFFARLRG